MTLAHGTDRLESARLVLRRITPDDLPLFARIHALPEVTQYLYPEVGRARPKRRSHGCGRSGELRTARHRLGRKAGRPSDAAVSSITPTLLNQAA